MPINETKPKLKTMNTTTRGATRWCALKSVALGALAYSVTFTASLAGEGNRNPGVIPLTPGTAKTYEALSVAWRDWQQGVIDQTGLSPFSDDPTGALCGVNQQGKYWHLAGAPADTENPVVRTCTVPAGKFIHFPIINLAWITQDEAGAEQIADPGFRAFVEGLFEGALNAEETTLGVTIDGIELANLHDYLVESPVFELPYYGSLENGFLNFDSGYYLLLAPLSRGAHTIHISGSFPLFGNTITVDVTYELTVGR